MTRAILVLGFVFSCAIAATAQESGNRVYGNNQQGPQRPARGGALTGELLLYDPKDQTLAPYVEAYVLMNVKADEFVAVFGAIGFSMAKVSNGDAQAGEAGPAQPVTDESSGRSASKLFPSGVRLAVLN